MPIQDIIQWQNEIIQRSLSIINEYERGKSEAETRLKREKGTAEYWKRTRAESNSAIKSIHEAMN